MITRINYNETDFSSVIEKILSTAQSFLKIVEKKFTRSINTAEKELVTNLMSHLLSLLPGFKDAGYEAEQEHRLFQMEIYADGKYYPHEMPNKFTSGKTLEISQDQRKCVRMDTIDTHSEIPRAFRLCFLMMISVRFGLVLV